MTIRIFTKAFLRMNHANQVAIVDMVLRDLRDSIGRHGNPIDDANAEQMIRRIEKKAVQYGIYAEESPENGGNDVAPM